MNNNNKNDLKERIKSNIRITNNQCWIWLKCKNEFGYGRISFKGKMYKAHRLSYEVFKGIIPEGLFVLHKCDNPACVNPDHLFLGSQADNMHDKALKNRSLKGEKNCNAKLTTNNIIEIKKKLNKGEPTKNIAREFKVCVVTILNIRNNRAWNHVS